MQRNAKLAMSATRTMQELRMLRGITYMSNVQRKQENVRTYPKKHAEKRMDIISVNNELFARLSDWLVHV